MFRHFKVKTIPDKNIPKTSESKQSSSQKPSKPVDQLSSSMTSATSKNVLSTSKDKPNKTESSKDGIGTNENKTSRNSPAKVSF